MRLTSHITTITASIAFLLLDNARCSSGSTGNNTLPIWQDLVTLDCMYN